jgi:rhodanese-related sulfurtransferase
MADKITARELTERKDGFVLIDVREVDELEEGGKIDGATRGIRRFKG